MGGKSIPKCCFLNQIEVFKVIDGKKVWRNEDGTRLYTWDSLHGEIEVYNKRGLHIGVLDTTGEYIKEAVKGRKIDL